MVCPEGYELKGEVDERARKEAKGSYVVCHDPAEGVPGVVLVVAEDEIGVSLCFSDHSLDLKERS